MSVKSINITEGKAAMRKAASSNLNRIYVFPSMGGWSVKKEGLRRSSGKYEK